MRSRYRRVWLIYKDKHKTSGFPVPTKLYLNIDNFQTGITFAWNVSRQRATKYDTKLDAETAAIRFTGKHPEFLGVLKTTWMKTRVAR